MTAKGTYEGQRATSNYRRFLLYEDDNETYNYEKGQRAIYELTWNDAAQTLTVGPRFGSFPGMVAKRQLNIVLASPGRLILSFSVLVILYIMVRLRNSPFEGESKEYQLHKTRSMRTKHGDGIKCIVRLQRDRFRVARGHSRR